MHEFGKSIDVWMLALNFRQFARDHAFEHIRSYYKQDKEQSHNLLKTIQVTVVIVFNWELDRLSKPIQAFKFPFLTELNRPDRQPCDTSSTIQTRNVQDHRNSSFRLKRLGWQYCLWWSGRVWLVWCG